MERSVAVLRDPTFRASRDMHSNEGGQGKIQMSRTLSTAQDALLRTPPLLGVSTVLVSCLSRDSCLDHREVALHVACGMMKLWTRDSPRIIGSELSDSLFCACSVSGSTASSLLFVYHYLMTFRLQCRLEDVTTPTLSMPNNIYLVNCLR